jgi:hypothetical protein
MNLAKNTAIAAVLLLLAMGFGATSAFAASDYKAVTPSLCAPYGTATTQNELVFTQLGVANPGTTNESVICTVPADAESSYSGSDAVLYAWFRTGAVPGKVACTVFVNNATMSEGTVNTYSANPPNYGSNIRSVLTLYMTNPGGGWGIGAPTAVVCTLTPKAVLGGFTFLEVLPTDAP